MLYIIQEKRNNEGVENIFYSRLLNGTPSKEVMSAFIFGKYPKATLQFDSGTQNVKATVYHDMKGDIKSYMEVIQLDNLQKSDKLKYLTHEWDINYINNQK